MFYSDLHAILEDSGTHGPGYARFRGRVGCVPRPGKASTVPVISRPAGTCSFPSLPSKPGNRFRGITKHKYEACNLDFYSLQGLGGACVGDRGRREAPVRELSVLGLGVRLLPRSVLSLGLPPVPLRTLTHAGGRSATKLTFGSRRSRCFEGNVLELVGRLRSLERYCFFVSHVVYVCTRMNLCSVRTGRLHHHCSLVLSPTNRCTSEASNATRTLPRATVGSGDISHWICNKAG